MTNQIRDIPRGTSRHNEGMHIDLALDTYNGFIVRNLPEGTSK